MGFLGSSRKKPSDPFHAAAEQQSKRTLAARLRADQSGSARQSRANYFRRGGLPTWPDHNNGHPYEQPGLGFYSGEHLPFGRTRQREPKRSFSIDDGVGIARQRSFSELYGQDLPFSSHGRYPARFQDGDVRDFADPPLMGHGLWTTSKLHNPSYDDPKDQSAFPDWYNAGGHGLSASTSPFNRSKSPDGRRFPSSRNPPLNGAVFPEGLVFNGPRPFNNFSMPGPHTPPMYCRNNPPELSTTWNSSTHQDRDPMSTTRAAYGPPHPPGSYERLRPPHLSRTDGRPGSATAFSTN